MHTGIFGWDITCQYTSSLSSFYPLLPFLLPLFFICCFFPLLISLTSLSLSLLYHLSPLHLPLCDMFISFPLLYPSSTPPPTPHLSFFLIALWHLLPFFLQDLGLQAEDHFVLKVVQLEELIQVRHSVMVIGNAGTGE